MICKHKSIKLNSFEYWYISLTILVNISNLFTLTAPYLPSRKLSKLDEPDMQDTAGESGTGLISDVLLWTPHVAEQKQGNLLEPTYSSSVRIWDVALRTGQERWTIGRSGERGFGISVLAARQNDGEMSKSSIWPIDRTLSGATTPGQSEPGSDGNGGIVCIP